MFLLIRDLKIPSSSTYQSGKIGITLNTPIHSAGKGELLQTAYYIIIFIVVIKNTVTISAPILNV
jgi:hypothetical protein